MNYPVVAISGQAGSGKDVVSRMIAEQTNGTIIALADPLKQTVQDIYGFSNDQLWGDSAQRSIPSIVTGDIKRLRSAIDRIYSKTKIRSDLSNVYDYIDQIESKLSPYPTEYIPRERLQVIGDGIRRVHPGYWIELNKRLVTKALEKSMSYNRYTGEFVPETNPPVDLVVVSDARYRDEILALKSMGAFMIRVVDPNATNTDQHVSETQMMGIPDSWFSLILTNDRNDGLLGLRRAVTRIVEKYIKAVETTHSDYVCGVTTADYAANYPGTP
jgi:hypothetical protein